MVPKRSLCFHNCVNRNTRIWTLSHMKRPAGPCYPEFMNQTGNFPPRLSVVILRNLFELDNTLGPCSTLNAVVILKISLAPVFRVKSFEPDCLLCLKHSHLHRGSNSTASQVGSQSKLRTQNIILPLQQRERESVSQMWLHSPPHIYGRNIHLWSKCCQIFTLWVYLGISYQERVDRARVQPRTFIGGR